MREELRDERATAVAYADVKRLAAGRSKRLARIAWQTFQQQYPDYDPDGLAARLGQSPPSRQQRGSGGQQTSTPLGAEGGLSRLLPVPFAWVEIPGQGYSIAKYPLTNAQFAPFVKSGGYKEKRWWTEAGWETCQQQKWTEPRLWQDSKWNGAEYPVVGVSWYEAVAYCMWLSEQSGQKIMLPTEKQWQYAAQGDDGRAYPWGNEWDCHRCNNSVTPCNNNSTSPVTAYEGQDKGDSPFGVVDMVGNVWEWCLTDYETGSNELSGTNVRVLRGGSWGINYTDLFRVSFRYWDDPYFRGNFTGFRLALS
jgi:formylglycine-generating enzyme required for sulfatase activity